MKIRIRRHGYFTNLALALDQLLSAICGYDADCTVSAALGEIMVKKYNGGNIPYGKNPFHAWLQRHLDRVEKDHCIDAYNKELNRWPGGTF